MTRFLRRFVAGQVALCRWMERSWFAEFSVDGNESFARLAPAIVQDGDRLADIGGGKTPFFSAAQVAMRRLQVVGVDIDGSELAAADPGAYAATVVAPIEAARGGSDCNVVLAQSVLEHVTDGHLAAHGMASFLRPGGTLVTFCPCRRAWFARLNRLLPERLKRFILFSVFPEKRERQGYPAFYDGCTPAEFRRNLGAAGIEVLEFRYFFTSSYFMFFVPLYLFWRLATYPLMKLWPHRYCETFICIGKKKLV